MCRPVPFRDRYEPAGTTRSHTEPAASIARHALYDQLIGHIGDESATTLMELLPGVPASELFTKADSERLKHELLAAMDRRFAVQTRVFVLATVGSNVTLVGLVVAALQLA